jgi:hypothetical protein
MDKKLLVVALAALYAVYFLVALFVYEAFKMGATRGVILVPAVFAAIVTYGVYRRMVRNN